MAFVANPLSLTVPEHAFEAWLRDTGYLELLDARSASASASSSAAASLPSSPGPNPPPSPGLLASLRTLASLPALNPFAKLTAEGLAGSTPSWTLDFLSRPASYSWPAGPAQARLRVHENVRRYARNYASLTLLFFACCLYRTPITLLGLVSCLGIWELLRYGSDKWELEETYPALRQVLVRIGQFATAVILYLCNLQFTLFCAVSVSYTVMILHAFLRKLTPPNQSNGVNPHKKFLQKKVHFSSR